MRAFLDRYWLLLLLIALCGLAAKVAIWPEARQDWLQSGSGQPDKADTFLIDQGGRV